MQKHQVLMPSGGLPQGKAALATGVHGQPSTMYRHVQPAGRARRGSCSQGPPIDLVRDSCQKRAGGQQLQQAKLSTRRARLQKPFWRMQLNRWPVFTPVFTKEAVKSNATLQWFDGALNASLLADICHKVAQLAQASHATTKVSAAM